MPAAPTPLPNEESLSVEHPVLDELAAVSTGLERVCGASWWAMTDRVLEAVLPAVAKVVAQASSVQLGAVREVDGRALPSRVGSTSTAAFLRHRLNLRHTTAGRLTRLAAALDGDQALTGEALAAGTIDLEQAEAIVRAIRSLPASVPADVPGRAELFLLGEAETKDADELTRLGHHLKALWTEPPDDSADPADVRELHLTDTATGSVRLRGELDAETGGLLRSALDPLAKPQPGLDGTPDPRSAARRRADALADLVHRAVTAGTLPATGGVRPHVTVLVDLPRLLGRDGAPPAEDGWGLPLSQATLDRICCDADVTRVVLGPGGVPLDLGRTHRLVPPPLRRAVVARDRCCAFPGCDRPASWCECHHIQHWTRDHGKTALDNLVLLCGRHHRAVHHDGWDVRMAPDERPEFLPPAWIDPDRRPRRNHHYRRLADLLDGSPLDSGPLSEVRPPTSRAAGRTRAKAAQHWTATCRAW